MNRTTHYIRMADADDWIARGWSVVWAGAHHAEYGIAWREV